MELGTFEVDGGHVCIRYDNAAGVLAGVEFTAHSEAGFGGSGRNQLDDHPIADEWLGAPVLAADSDEVAWAIRDDVARDSEMISPGCGASLA